MYSISNSRRTCLLFSTLLASNLLAGTVSAQTNSAQAHSADDARKTESFAGEERLALLQIRNERVPMERLMVVGHPQNRARIAGSVNYIGEEQLETFKYQDIQRILRLVPGVNIREEEGFGLRPNIGLRGTTVDRSSQITLMEDGVLIAPAPYAAPAAYYFPVAGRMSAVEVTKGAAAVRFGPRTVGGAINLVSRDIPEDFGGFLDARFGEFDLSTFHGAIGGTFHVDQGLLQNVGFLVESFQSESDGFKRLPDNSRTGGFDIEDYVVKLKADTGNAADIFQSIQLKLGYTDNDSDVSYLGLTDEDFAENPFQRYAASANDIMTTEHWQAQLNHYAEFSKSFSLTTVAYYNDFKRDWFKVDDLDFGDGRFSPVVLFQPIERFQSTLQSLRGGPVGLDEATAERQAILDVLRGDANSIDDAIQLRHNNRSYWSAGLQSIAAYEFNAFGATHDLEFSVRYHEDRENRLQNRENFKMENGTLVLTSVDPIGSQSNRVDKAKAWAINVQDNIEWGRWRFTPGARVEIIDLARLDFSTSDPDRLAGTTGERNNSLTLVSPGLGVFYSLTDEITLLGGIHKGVNPPSPSDSNAKEEESLNLEAGLRYENNGVSFEFTAFYNDISNMLGTCSFSRGCVDGEIGDQFNVGSAEVLGLEAQAAYDIALGDSGLIIPLRGNYTFTDAEFREAVDSPVFGAVAIGDEIPDIPRHQFTLSGGLEANDWAITVLANYTSATRSEAGQGDIPDIFKIDNRVVLDLASHYQLLENLRLFFEIKNLTDKTHAVSRLPYGLRPGQPQTVIGGVKLSF
ncbi:TonB-dependent receptor [Iodidimonas sp. MBR-14]|uniref:TonB-dependent receptor family protein n=1 Tax=Iodidimonas sp. MBR-14 TaxID=3032319 RepID=UPI002482510A|nr:TonB-dependent receptor [Iodidimonas sp. MBR-14]